MVYSPQRQRRLRRENYTNPNQPDYRPVWWELCVEHWYKTLDWCGHLDDPLFKEDYLAHVAGELTPDRATRIEADSPEPFFKDAVNDHASLFSQFELSPEAPQSLQENEDNVDLQGSDLWQWSLEPLTALFRDGGALLGCDIDRSVVVGDRRPRLLWIPLRDVYWVEYRTNNGVSKLSRCSIRRTFNDIDRTGNLKLRNAYYVYELNEQGFCKVQQWREDSEDRLVMEGDPILLVDAANQPLTRLPFTDSFTLLGDLNINQERTIMSPMADVLLLNQEHYNAKSEYNTVKRKTALPTPMRFWEGGVPENPPPFYAGPGRCIDMNAGSDARYLELDGESLPELREALAKIEEKIHARDNKLFNSTVAKTAREAEIENQKSKVGLPRMKALIESAFQDVFSVWELLANPQPSPDISGIVIDDVVLQPPSSPQDMLPYVQAIDRGVPINAVVNAMIRKGIFSREDFEEPMITIPPPTMPDEPMGDALSTNPDEVIE
mgnify:CR=1 FL=1